VLAQREGFRILRKWALRGLNDERISFTAYFWGPGKNTAAPNSRFWTVIVRENSLPKCTPKNAAHLDRQKSNFLRTTLFFSKRSMLNRSPRQQYTQPYPMPSLMTWTFWSWRPRKSYTRATRKRLKEAIWSSMRTLNAKLHTRVLPCLLRQECWKTQSKREQPKVEKMFSSMFKRDNVMKIHQVVWHSKFTVSTMHHLKTANSVALDKVWKTYRWFCDIERRHTISHTYTTT